MSLATGHAQVILSAVMVFIVGVVSPGPNFLLMTTTATRSRSDALKTAVGFALAAVTWTICAGTGLGLLLSRAIWMQTLVRLAGGAYLVFLGLRLLRRRTTSDIPEREGIPSRNPLWRGYATNVTNPKSAAFFTSIFASVVPPHEPIWVLAALACSTGAVSLCWHSLLALALSSSPVTAAFERRRTLCDRVCGGLLVAIGIRFIASS